MRPTRVQSLEDVIVWVIDHDSRIDVWWEQQHVWNARMEQKMDRISLRLTALEKRVMWLSGAAAAIGALIGNLLGRGIGP